MSENDAQIQFDIYKNLKNMYQLEIDTDLSINIKDFDIFSQNELNDYGAVFRILKSSRFFYINFLEILYRSGVSRYSSNVQMEYQTWGFINLKGNFGHILIKPETFLDKIHNIINSVDLDFENDKEFSKKFLVVTNDRQKAESQMTQNFRNCIKQIELDEFVIEILETKLIIGDKKIVSAESTLIFAKFLNEIAIAF